MSEDDGDRRRKGVIWGLFLIAFGGVFLLQRAGYIHASTLASMWPLAFFAVGVAHLFERKPGDALTMFLMGSWFFAVQYDWMGLTYRNSWSLVLVAVGCGMVVKALSGEDRRRPGEEAGPFIEVKYKAGFEENKTVDPLAAATPARERRTQGEES